MVTYDHDVISSILNNDLVDLLRLKPDFYDEVFKQWKSYVSIHTPKILQYVIKERKLHPKYCVCINSLVCARKINDAQMLVALDHCFHHYDRFSRHDGLDLQEWKEWRLEMETNLNYYLPKFVEQNMFESFQVTLMWLKQERPTRKNKLDGFEQLLDLVIGHLNLPSFIKRKRCMQLYMNTFKISNQLLVTRIDYYATKLSSNVAKLRMCKWYRSLLKYESTQPSTSPQRDELKEVWRLLEAQEELLKHLLMTHTDLASCIILHELLPCM
jgi:hypothetical protein